MKKALTVIILGGLALSLAFVSCKKDKDTTPVDNITTGTVLTTSLSGLGSHGGHPSGTPYFLPSNIKVIGSMVGGYPGSKLNFNYPKSAENFQYYLASTPKTYYTEYGYGTYVNVCMELYNSSNFPYELIIPAGLILCDSIPNDSTGSDTTQSGIIITPDTIIIPQKGTAKVCLKSFCLNLYNHVPTSDNIFKMKVITNNDQLNKVVTILKNKKTLGNHLMDIQFILWNITDYGGLTQEDIDLMNSWQ